MSVPEKRAEPRRAPSAAVVAVVLAVFALSGLGAGVLSRSALGGLGLFASATPTATSLPTATATSAPSPVPSATPSPTLPAGRFRVTSAFATPRSFAAGDTFTVQVTVLAPDGVSPAAGVLCYLQAPDGENQLFTTWPAPQITASDGTGEWSLTAPAASPGTYMLRVIAYGQHGYSTWFDTTVTLHA